MENEYGAGNIFHGDPRSICFKAALARVRRPRGKNQFRKPAEGGGETT